MPCLAADGMARASDGDDCGFEHAFPLRYKKLISNECHDTRKKNEIPSSSKGTVDYFSCFTKSQQGFERLILPIAKKGWQQSFTGVLQEPWIKEVGNGRKSHRTMSLQGRLLQPTTNRHQRRGDCTVKDSDKLSRERTIRCMFVLQRPISIRRATRHLARGSSSFRV